MGKNNNIIEINGKRYDARTGAMLSPGSKEPIPSPQVVQPIMNPEPKSKSMHDVVRRPSKPASAHNPKPSKTLMRHAVKKPGPNSKIKLRAQGPTELAVDNTLTDVEMKKSAKSLDRKKLAEAQRIKQSQLIAHFGDVTSDANASAPQPIQQKDSAAKTLPKKQPVGKPKTTAELLDHAVAQATSHTEPAPKKTKRKKRLRLGLASVTALALLGFVGYQEMPKLQFNLAAAKAGFGATLPDYQPAGYSVGKLSYSPGIIATKFDSNSDQRNYTLTQKTSSWNSESLKENFVAANYRNYQTIQSAGRTIYLYGKGNATWVNGGIWYIIQGNDSLSNQQLVQIAKSI